jgi:hypothetical protein
MVREPVEAQVVVLIVEGEAATAVEPMALEETAFV